MTLPARLHGPLTLLVASAALQGLMTFSIMGMFLLTLFGRLVSVFSSGSVDEMAMMMGALTVAQGAFKIPQLVLIASSVMTGRAAIHMNSGGSLSVIQWGAAAAVIGPLIALITNVCALLSFDCFGLVFGGMGRLVLTGIGLVAWITTIQALHDPEIAMLFQTDEDREEAFQRS